MKTPGIFHQCSRNRSFLAENGIASLRYDKRWEERAITVNRFL